jgi:ribonuclease T1
MKVFRFALLLVLAVFIAYVRCVSPPTGQLSHGSSFAALSSKHSETAFPGPNRVAWLDANPQIPAKALQVLDYVRRTGEAPEGYVGGRIFENREGRLPSNGDYREFDVDPHHGPRNAERIIIEWNTKKAWYTGDHYQSLVPLP